MSQSMSTLGLSFQPHELSFPVPWDPHAVLHGHLSFLAGCTMLHLTTSAIGESSGLTASLGSFVYAMPDHLNPRNAISTPISSSGSSLEYATRLSRILAIKLGQPVYVGCSMNLFGMTTEEELEGLTKIVNEVVNARRSD